MATVKYKMSSEKTSAKVWAATVAALLTPIGLGLLAKAFPDIPLPVDANDLLQQVIQGAIIGALTFAAGRLKRPDAADIAVPDPATRPQPPADFGPLRPPQPE